MSIVNLAMLGLRGLKKDFTPTVADVNTFTAAVLNEFTGKDYSSEIATCMTGQEAMIPEITAAFNNLNIAKQTYCAQGIV